jgi:hypothetical protein
VAGPWRGVAGAASNVTREQFETVREGLHPVGGDERLHTFRRTYATFLKANGEDVKTCKNCCAMQTVW